MSRRQKQPLREFSEEEHQWLGRIARSTSEPSGHVIRAKQLLAVAAGASFTKAAQVTGGKSGDAVAQLVARFNREGLKAVEPKKGSGAPPTYGAAERERILREVRRAPKPEMDGTANWSLTTLRRTLRRAEDGLPNVSNLYDWRCSQRSRFRLAANALLVPNRCFDSKRQRRDTTQGD